MRLGYRAAVKTLPDPGFAGDTGTAHPDLTDSLGRFAAGGSTSPVLAALSAAASTRLLVPVVASPPVPGPVAVDGAAADGGTDHREGDVATVLMRGLDGRLALLAFTSLDALAAWNPGARPVPVTARAAAAAALGEGASALLLDPAGPVTFVVETAELTELALGHRLRETSLGHAWFTDRLSTAP